LVAGLWRESPVQSVQHVPNNKYHTYYSYRHDKIIDTTAHTRHKQDVRAWLVYIAQTLPSSRRQHIYRTETCRQTQHSNATRNDTNVRIGCGSVGRGTNATNMPLSKVYPRAVNVAPTAASSTSTSTITITTT
jgi:hypothetical protein